MHLHILGICGTFMGGIAAIAREAGHRVTGCDAQVYPPMSEQLRTLGIDLIEGFDASQRALKPDVWVIGNVVSRGNPLLEAILDDGLPYTSGPQWLAQEVLHRRWVLAVAGTHGKTTTTAMLSWILQDAGMEPGFLVGGIPANFPVSARLGQGRHFVIEADEYDTAFFDKRSKFVHYLPRTAVLNNLEFDHADIFPDLAAIENQFHQLVRIVPRRGHILFDERSPALQRVLERGCWSPRTPLNSLHGWYADTVEETADGMSFGVQGPKGQHGRCTLALNGAHNRANALAALAAADHAGVDPREAVRSLSRFEGVRRRMEQRGVVRGVTVYDDFAHHPTAIQTTIEGLRARIRASGQPDGRILAVVEPRSNTMKLGHMKALLPGSLQGADRVWCHAATLGWDPVEVLAPLGERARVTRQLPELVQSVVAAARAGDHILVMSNGGFGGVHGLLLDALADAATPSPVCA